MCPDPVQSAFLRQNPHRAISNPVSLTLIVSPSARQSAEFLRKTETFLAALQIEPKGAAPNHPWHRIAIPATQCPRIRAEFLEDERRSMPDLTFSQEYLCEFIEPNEAYYYIGVDLGQRQDYTAIAIIEHTEFVNRQLRDRVTYDFIRTGRTAVRRLGRLPLNTSYAPSWTVCATSRAATGVGQAVIDQIKKEGLPCRLTALTITAGTEARGQDLLLNQLEISFRTIELQLSKLVPETTKLQSLRHNRAGPGRDDFDFALSPGQLESHQRQAAGGTPFCLLTSDSAGTANRPPNPECLARRLPTLDLPPEAMTR